MCRRARVEGYMWCDYAWTIQMARLDPDESWIDAGGGLDGWWGDGNKEGVSMALSFVYSGFYYYYSNMLCAAVLLS